jgi:hypothetical protein
VGRAGGREEAAAEEAVLDGAQLYAAVALALLEGGRPFEVVQLVGVVVPLVQPRPAGGRELLGQVELADVDEAG